MVDLYGNQLSKQTSSKDFKNILTSDFKNDQFNETKRNFMVAVRDQNKGKKSALNQNKSTGIQKSKPF